MSKTTKPIVKKTLTTIIMTPDTRHIPKARSAGSTELCRGGCRARLFRARFTSHAKDTPYAQSKRNYSGPGAFSQVQLNSACTHPIDLNAARVVRSIPQGNCLPHRIVEMGGKAAITFIDRFSPTRTLRIPELYHDVCGRIPPTGCSFI